MVKAIVIVESPAKVKTINKILGSDFKVVSSMGHLIDLPKSTLGVDVTKDFEPKLIVMRDKSKVMSQLKKEVKGAKIIYIATDPDREGEAIGWNLVQHIGQGKKVYRVSFQEITKEAVLKAFEKAGTFDERKVKAQIARRILDRIVGYKISPILWKKVGSRLSAGRVQSVALRLIVERERQIKAFVPKEYWQIAAEFQKSGNPIVIKASLEKINDAKFEIFTQSQTAELVESIKKESFVVRSISQKQVKRNPGPPLITSTLQQEAFNKLRFNASKTMMLAQQLYEGIDLGEGETVGLITYMRTDSVNISQEALGRVRSFIQSNYGSAYLPEKPNVYKSRKSAQEAHEAIRPANVLQKPKDVAAFLDPDQLKLYELIWNRFVSSQMVPAVYLQQKMEITGGKFQFGSSGSKLTFKGFLAVDEDLGEEESPVDFSSFKKDNPLKIKDVQGTQHFTKPPARFSDASLVKDLEEDGIGRPSTYASIIQTLVMRNYIQRERGYFTPTELGILICDLLVEYFAKIMDVKFTAEMEEKLDLVEEGKLEYPKLLHKFYQPFQEELAYAEENIVKTQNFVDKNCPLCGKQMVMKWGRRGQFISCSDFPNCKHAEPILSGVKCPQEGCGGELIKRRSRRGAFYGCSRYPQCTFVSKELPSVGASPSPAPADA
jgi:DNA topoisomerase-1